MMRDVEIVAVCYIFIGIFGVIGNGMIVISLGKVSNALWFASQKDHLWLVEQCLKILQVPKCLASEEKTQTFDLSSWLQ